ncbi:uncharacterized protein THITE_2111968 [Thermothielavioides terrestris NRRL 8126]|uniref:Uncharacterized protein n=1 Tax=Thermothielavioides terrestris (strain ATCC 38088 / NRRL 8126) TaxID=578455 RepID=G2R455_THETT|nr:uncharacterized protein THITE_2111968 [Thermothielavioides terrestris NRRL 8126]AEO65197.1 hypothetical protein THITE_2111968 [Thermothielavioides terrestris NRRL 8126]
MKPSSLYVALGAAQLAICAPLPLVMTERLYELPATAHHIAAVARTRTTYWVREPDSDRQHDTPTRSTMPQPFHAQLLPPLFKHRPSAHGESQPGQPTGGRRRHRKIDLIPLRLTVSKVDDSTEVVDLGVPAQWLPFGMRHQHHGRQDHLLLLSYGGRYFREQQNDVLVVVLVAAFVVIVVLMETWGSISRRLVALRQAVSRRTQEAPS